MQTVGQLGCIFHDNYGYFDLLFLNEAIQMNSICLSFTEN